VIDDGRANGQAPVDVVVDGATTPDSCSSMTIRGLMRCASSARYRKQTTLSSTGASSSSSGRFGDPAFQITGQRAGA
jgi:hypothetical protein